MIVTGYYQRLNQNQEVKTFRNVRFESTGIKSCGKVIWRKIKKDGKPSNTFCEQFQPNVPWLTKAKWFCKLDSGAVLKEHPELMVETVISKEMSFEDYCDYLTSNYYG